ncbi:MAG: hypothetical protein HXY44_14755 [Syntrophaceae bacterium]|nr:hypothetical protein [Syntrophaceae bacterium]
MSLKYAILNLLVLVLLLLLVFKNYEVWTEPIEVIPPREEPKRVERKVEAPFSKGSSENPLTVQSYLFIAEKNIFSPTRKDFPVLPAVGSKPIVRPQIVLYGVTIVGDYQVASLINPGRPLRKGERELMTLKIGEQIGEYKLTKILSDRIALETDGDSFEVLLYDPGKPKKRVEVKTEVKPPTVTSTQPTPSALAPVTARPTSPPIPTDVPRPPQPSPSVTTPPPATSTPTQTPTLPPPGVGRRGRTIYSPSSGTPTQGPGENQ